MYIKFWGVRGSIPTPIGHRDIKDKIKNALLYARASDILSERDIERFIDSLAFEQVATFGGNTTCIEVRTDDNKLFIIDCGTGIRNLGNYLMSTEFGRGKGKAYVYLSHTHWDHIQGIPFFLPLYIEGNKFYFISHFDDIKERLEYQQDKRFFPVSFQEMPATKKFVIMKSNALKIGDVLIKTMKTKHPGDAYAIKISSFGKSFIYSSDAEISIDEYENLGKYINFIKGGNVLAFDTQYTLEEFLIKKIDWGHSSANTAIDIAGKSGIEKLILFHHDPSYDDEKLRTLYMKAENYKNMVKYQNLELIMAYEGLEIEI